MDVYLIDGTYELFRHFYAVPSAREADGREVGAVRGVLTSMLGMINSGTRYIGVATDHVIESFRNRLWPGYKTGAGIDPDLLRAVPAARRRRSPRSASPPGRWSNTKPTMRWPRRRPPPRATRA